MEWAIATRVSAGDQLDRKLGAIAAMYGDEILERPSIRQQPDTFQQQRGAARPQSQEPRRLAIEGDGFDSAKPLGDAQPVLPRQQPVQGLGGQILVNKTRSKRMGQVGHHQDLGLVVQKPQAVQFNHGRALLETQRLSDFRRRRVIRRARTFVAGRCPLAIASS